MKPAPTFMNRVRFDEISASHVRSPLDVAIQKSGFDGRCRGLPRSVLHWGVGHDVPDAP